MAKPIDAEREDLNGPDAHPPQYGSLGVAPGAQLATHLFNEKRRLARRRLWAILDDPLATQGVVLDTMHDPVSEEWDFMVVREGAESVARRCQVVTDAPGTPVIITQAELANAMRGTDARYLRTYYEMMEELYRYRTAFYLSRETKIITLKRSPDLLEAAGEDVFGKHVRTLHFYVLVVNCLETRMRKTLRARAPVLTTAPRRAQSDDEGGGDESERPAWPPSDSDSDSEAEAARARVASPRVLYEEKRQVMRAPPKIFSPRSVLRVYGAHARAMSEGGGERLRLRVESPRAHELDEIPLAESHD